MELKYLIIAAFALILLPTVSADHCDDDCPYWAQGSYYSTPSSTSQYENTYWYDDYPQTQYVFQDVYHPPKHYYVHYNQNYINHARGYTTQYRNYRYSNYAVPTDRYEERYYNQANYRNRYTAGGYYSYNPGNRVLIGDGWERHY